MKPLIVERRLTEEDKLIRTCFELQWQLSRILDDCINEDEGVMSDKAIFVAKAIKDISSTFSGKQPLAHFYNYLEKHDVLGPFMYASSLTNSWNNFCNQLARVLKRPPIYGFPCPTKKNPLSNVYPTMLSGSVLTKKRYITIGKARGLLKFNTGITKLIKGGVTLL